jgi:hypothetical protein
MTSPRKVVTGMKRGKASKSIGNIKEVKKVALFEKNAQKLF